MRKFNKPRPAAAHIIRRHQTVVRENRLVEPFCHSQATGSWKTAGASKSAGEPKNL